MDDFGSFRNQFLTSYEIILLSLSSEKWFTTEKWFTLWSSLSHQRPAVQLLHPCSPNLWASKRHTNWPRNGQLHSLMGFMKLYTAIISSYTAPRYNKNTLNDIASWILISNFVTSYLEVSRIVTKLLTGELDLLFVVVSAYFCWHQCSVLYLHLWKAF
jgi:hypothetical protein